MKLGRSNRRSSVHDGSTERAVSPVIGVILMVAITVILAAVIGVFVLGLGDELSDSAPSASLSFETGENAEEVDVIHNSGDTLDLEDITILVEGDSDVGDWEVAVDEFAPGETATIESTGATADTVEIQLRHDPSDSIIASGDVETGE